MGKRVILVLTAMLFISSCNIEESDLCINFGGAGGASTSGLKTADNFTHLSPQNVQHSVILGSWLLYENGNIANSLGVLDDDSLQIYEPTNVLWIDYQSASITQAREKINQFMEDSGFNLEGCPLHTAQYSVTYNRTRTVIQTPRNATWAGAEWPNTNNHGRVFPAFRQTGSGESVYYTLGAFSREKSAGEFHEFLSFDIARDALRPSNGWRDKGIFPLQNIYPADSLKAFTTQDHSGTRVFELR